MGGSRGVSYSHSYGRGGYLSDGRQIPVVRFASDFSAVRIRVRVHDSAPSFRRLTHTVVSGDTLYGIGHFYGETWQQVYGWNRKIIRDPNMIYPGQVVAIPPHGFKYVVAGQVPVRPVARLLQSDGDGDSDHDSSDHHVSSAVRASVAFSGSYNCGALEALWISVGGNSGSAFIAAEIAMAESGGNPNAISPTDDFGLWQINGSHGSLATLNPVDNARAAVIVSGNGSNWSPWTTFTSGAYIGRC